ncbi:MAG: LytR/AlgR family response regulator transcription factor [Eggerthellaceae bacterium]|jgi:DNA-binding LytR/AlgR family response regulator
MNTLNVAICEDRRADTRRLMGIIRKAPFNASITTYVQARDFVRAYTPGIYDLVFMDIFMAEPDAEGEPDAPETPCGIEAVAALRRVDPLVPVVFTTNSTDFALDGYRLNVSQYLTKPVQAEAVYDVLAHAHEAKLKRPGLQVRVSRKDVTVCPDQLVFAEQSGHYFTLTMVDGRTLRVRGRLDQLEEKLANPQFLRCHHSYLVNLALVQDIDSDTMSVALYGGNTAFIRRGWLSRTRTAWEDWMFAMARKKDAADES